MKKLTLLFVILSITALTAVKGFQVVEENSLHLMNGEMMTGHEMPSPECDTNTCLMLAETTLIIGAFMNVSMAESIIKILLTFGFVFTALQILSIPKWRASFTQNHLQKIPIGVESVIFRE